MIFKSAITNRYLINMKKDLSVLYVVLLVVFAIFTLIAFITLIPVFYYIGLASLLTSLIILGYEMF